MLAPVYGLAESTPIKLGGILILTGQSAEYGVQAQRGAQLALDEINGAGGVIGRQLTVIWEDETSGKAERAVAAYRKLVHVDGVKFILGPSFQDGLLAIAPLAKTDGVAIITPSTPSLGLPQVFATWIDPEIEAAFIATYIRKSFKRVSVLAAQQSWEIMVAESFKKNFVELGGEIVSYAAPLNTNTDVRTEVLQVRRAKPEAVFISSYTLLANYIVGLRKQGVTVPLFTIEADNAALRTAGKSSDGLVSVGPSVPESSFARKYKARYGVAPDSPSFQAYDAVQLLARAMKAKGEKPIDVLHYLSSFDSFSGASGTIRSVEGKKFTSMAPFVASNGEFKRLE
jgi:branched-chain amino acid transport system substrate-binding protein